MNDEVLSKLAVLKDLYEKGTITEEQLAAKKAKILSDDESTSEPKDVAQVNEGKDNEIDEGVSVESSAQDDNTQTMEEAAPGKSQEQKKF